MWLLTQLAVRFRWSKRAGSQAIVVWQFSHALLLETCFAVLPEASVPLWQLAQLLITPAWVIGARAVPRSPTPIDGAALVAAANAGLIAGFPPRALGALAVAEMTDAVGDTTVVTLTADFVPAMVLFAAPPPQLFGLWHLLQSWPTWWPLGRVVKLVTPLSLIHI